MAYKNGIANSLKHMQEWVKMFACGYPLPTTPVFSGSGIGALKNFTTEAGAVAENWTATCTVSPAAPVITSHGVNLGAEDGVYIDNLAGQHDPAAEQILVNRKGLILNLLGLPTTGWLQYDTRPPFFASNTFNPPASGEFAFTASHLSITEELLGTLVDTGALSASYQQLDLVADGVSATNIDLQAAVFRCSVSRKGEDSGWVELHFLDASFDPIAVRHMKKWTNVGGWAIDTVRYVIPPGCRHINVVMVGEKVGSDNEAYFDDFILETETHPGRFSLTGSSSGSIGPCAVHPYQQIFANVSLTIDDPTYSFSPGDQFTLTTEANELAGTGAEWLEHRNDYYTTYGNLGSETLIEGPGASGADSVFVGMRSNFTTGTEHFITLGGFTGFDDKDDFYNQPGAIPEIGHGYKGWPALGLHDQNMEFWMMVNGRRIMAVIKAGAVYVHVYLGFLKTYYTPQQYPYPMVVGGSMLNSDTNSPSAGDPSTMNRAYWNCCQWDYSSYGTVSALRYRTHAGAWGVFRNKAESDGWSKNIKDGVWPWNWNSLYSLGVNLDGSYPLFPAVLHEGDDITGASGLHGEFEGLFAIPGKSAVVEDIINVGADQYMVFQNCGESDDSNYCAVKLE